MTAQGIINTPYYTTENPLFNINQLYSVSWDWWKKRRELKEWGGKGKKTLAVDKPAGLNLNVCEMFSLFFCSPPSLFVCVRVCVFYLPLVLSDSAKKLPRPPELCVAHQIRPSERTLMCDFPSTCCPKWICTSAIIFCHYSFWARHCAEIQTILAVWCKKKNREKGERKSVKLVGLWQQ